jgi:hypothetical protein
MAGRMPPASRLAAAATALLVALATAAEAQTACVLPERNVDAEQLAERCAACLRADRMLDAGKLWYAASIRLRTLASVDDRPDRTPALMGALQETLGRRVNEWLGGDVRDWRAAVDWAIAWDRRTNYADLAQAIRALGAPVDLPQARAAYERQRAGIGSMRASLADDPAGVYRQRRAAGLRVRDPRFDPATGRVRPQR